MSRYGIGDPNKMVCAQMKELMAIRDAWINKWGMRCLIHEHDTAKKSSENREQKRWK